MFHLFENEHISPTAKRPLNNTIPSGKENELQLEYSKNDIQSTEEDVHGSLKQVGREDNDNDENTKYDKMKRSKVCTYNLDQWESDDPRRGGKICLEKMRNINTLGISNVYEKKEHDVSEVFADCPMLEGQHFSLV